jgi:hypothetical protein
MKSKFLNFITVSLATSILLASAQKAFSFSAKPQTTLNEIQHLVHNETSNQKAAGEGTQNQGRIQEGSAPTSRQSYPAHFVPTTYQTSASNQAISGEQTIQLNNTAGGVFVTFLFISYVLVGLRYRKHRMHRAAVLLQQIETLERIWRMNPQQR